MPFPGAQALPPRDARDWLDEMEGLACAIARGAPTDRREATAYLAARDALLASDVAPLLPGFLIQCHSVHRLRDFLTLYDPEPELREAFMARTFDRCREAMSAQHLPRGRSTSQEWMS